jgi:hypothetical protein
MDPTQRAARSPQSAIRDLAVIGLTLILMFAALIYIVGQESPPETPESVGSSLSAGPRGTLALYRWLERTGFQVERVQGGETFPPSDGTLIMVNPNDDFPEGQAGSVRRWVEEGNTLILATGRRNSDLSAGLGGRHPMLREFDVDLDFAQLVTDTVPAAQPLFGDPSVDRVRIPTVWNLIVPVTSTTVLLSSRDDDGNRLPLAAVMMVGAGKLILLSSDYPLSNEGIREESNGALTYNLVQMAGSRRVVFDEAHHGAEVGGDIMALLTSTPWGWALIYGSVLVMVFLLWSAKRLGPPLPVWTPDLRRPTSDYVRSVAALFRRARKPGYAAERYLQYFKRTLTRHAELDPYLTDTRFVQALSERGRHTFNQEEMLRAIERLRQLEGGGSSSESVETETLKAIREAEKVRRQALGMSPQEEQA